MQRKLQLVVLAVIVVLMCALPIAKSVYQDANYVSVMQQ